MVARWTDETGEESTPQLLNAVFHACLAWVIFLWMMMILLQVLAHDYGTVQSEVPSGGSEPVESSAVHGLHSAVALYRT